NMDDKLIVAVCDHPELFNTASYWYRDRTKKDLAWRTIGEAVGLAADLCRKRWKGLRDTYLKEKRKCQEKRSGSAAGPSKRWKYSAVMSFLDPFISPRDTSSNMVQGVEEDRAAEYGHPSETGGLFISAQVRWTWSSWRPSEDLLLLHPPPMSADEMFLKSLLPTLQRVPPENREFVKLQMYKVLVDNLPVTLNLENFE
uniref:Transcription factor Adf-1 n=1 Tax=Gouania willdenowi TaxID=441366 RepID=A0A8C5GSV8_GOUWI